mmetsp:Transcript_15363/g.22603  ORF Transcript_15363/g.22603 Transcript_15363/m.22603 type:complete len:393 (-) Transcript_15363:100-1278(-)|eukprot:CAMPEP_0195529254 /NCGR_PEP_ID=MMETSP0794_2-20130614/31724_1 /TAXON_ID=515487 /ORGANISM="Stephanopyxis turris, Strain CCMP 815" /LENGTH=392 /DNA_ID=CAMNT_0040660535 /DNA_START=39 /DNA_END=1217 /DNA_ORIENTATION=-
MTTLKHSVAFVTVIAASTFITLFYSRTRKNKADKYNGDSTKSKNENVSSSIHNTTNTNPVADAALVQMFEAASTQVPKMKSIGNGDKLMFYGLYKQATVGDRDEEKKPSKWDVVASAKYAAWGKFAGMRKEEAMRNYIEMVHEFSNKDKNQKLDTKVTTSTTTGDVSGTGPLFDLHNTDDIVYSDDESEEDGFYDSDSDNEEPLEEKNNTANREKDGSASFTPPSGLGMRPSVFVHEDKTTTTTGGNANSSAILFDATSRNDISTLQSVLDNKSIVAGSNSIVNGTDESGQTPLHFAADGGCVECAQLLLDHGANPNAADKEGISVLQTAIMGLGMGEVAADNSMKVIQMLIRKGADLDQEDDDGETPRSCALEIEDEKLRNAICALFSSTE